MAATEISTAQAARILRVSTYEVRQLIAKNKLEARRLGFAPWLVSYKSVLDYKMNLEASRKAK